jgi:uncharacterized membrane protein
MRRLFAKGFAALLPMFLTIFVLYFVGKTIYDAVGVPLGEGMKWAAVTITDQTETQLRDSNPSWDRYFRWAPVVGFVVGTIIIFVVGAVVATFFGKRIYQLFEKILSKVPVIKVVYPYAKQFTEFFFKGEQKMEFKAVVAIPFPTEGIYSIAFPTSEGLRHLNDATKKKMVCVFVPTSPTPFTGYVVYVPREMVIILPITVEEAMRIIISCGVVTPPHQAASLTDAPAMPVTAPMLPPTLERHYGGVPPKP